MSIDKLECLCIIIGACLSSKRVKNIRGFVLLTDNEVSRFILSNGSAKANCLRKLSAILTSKMSRLATWFTILRTSSKMNLLCDRISRKKDITKFCDLECELIEQSQVDELVKNVICKLKDWSYVRFLRSLLSELELEEDD